MIFNEQVEGNIELLNELLGYDEAQDTLNESCVAKGRNFSLHVVSEAKFNNGGKFAYFKYYPKRDKYNDKEVLRISLREPVYIEHYKDGPKVKKLNSKQRKELIEVLLTPNMDNNQINNYQALIYAFNYFTGGRTPEETYNLGLSYKNPLDPAIPHNFIHPNYPMPDYTQLN